MVWCGVVAFREECYVVVKDTSFVLHVGGIGGVAEWLRRSVANLVRSSVLSSSPIVGTILPQVNSQLSCPSF